MAQTLKRTRRRGPRPGNGLNPSHYIVTVKSIIRDLKMEKDNFAEEDVPGPYISRSERLIPSIKENMTDKNISNLVSNTVSSFDEHGFYLSRAAKGLNTYCCGGSRRAPAKLNFPEWAHASLDSYMGLSGTEVVGYKTYPEKGTIRVVTSTRAKSLYYDIAGDRAAVLEFLNNLESQGFKEHGVSIVWVFGESVREMDSFNVPLSIPPTIPGAYPWMPESVASFTDRFINSKSSIVILLGPPGTGKTSFIKEMIKESGTSAMVTYDTGLLFSDGFFANFMTNDDTNLLVLEDADSIMGARSDGNTMMHKFLNASDGLISMQNKKIIFTTNLPSVKNIDSALVRKGRCFEVVTTRDMSFEEASVIAKEMYPGKELANKRYTLGELTNLGSNSSGNLENSGRVPTKVGFGFNSTK